MSQVCRFEQVLASRQPGDASAETPNPSVGDVWLLGGNT
jgi:hypothetical protein